MLKFRKHQYFPFLAYWLILTLSSFSQAHADQIYLTKDEALKIILGEDCPVTYEKKELPQELLETLDEENVYPRQSTTAHIFKCQTERTTKYAFIDQQIGKHMPITYIVGISSEGKVTGSEVLVYRENYGSQVKERRFLDQFIDKDLSNSLKVGKDIDYLSGATLSSIAITRGIKRDLIIWKYFFQPNNNKETKK